MLPSKVALLFIFLAVRAHTYTLALVPRRAFNHLLLTSLTVQPSSDECKDKLKRLVQYNCNDDGVNDDGVNKAIDKAIDDLLSSSTLTLLKYPSPLLRLVASPFPLSVLHDDKELALGISKALKRTCEMEGAVGLTLQQCGVPLSMVYMKGLKGGGLTMINPTVVGRSDERYMRGWNEVCMVFPEDLSVGLMRDDSVVVKFVTVEGVERVKTWKGEDARAVQHEIDHDRGVLMVDHVADLKELPEWIGNIEKAKHEERLAKAWSRSLG